ncbi:MAG: hypothetical protein JWR85_1723 [Marmoricola sp.]|nr:hypothetical protein [Marmoricola sp.]
MNALIVVSSRLRHAWYMNLISCSRPGRPAFILTLVCVAAIATGCGGGANTASSSRGSNTTVPKDTSSTGPGDTASGGSTQSGPAKPAAPVPVEKNPPGDIPDNLAFVKYTNKPGGYSFTHPEGWAQTGSGVRARFTDKLNGVAVESLSATRAPTAATARASDVERLRSSVPAFELKSISTVTVPAGHGVRIVFRRNSDADPVTGKIYRDEVEEYLVFHGGTLVRMDLYGPVGADNVDAYRTMSRSLSLP